MENIYTEYAELKMQEKEIKKQVDAKKKLVEQLMEEEGKKLEKNELGTFVMVPRKKWTYSKETQDLDTKLKLQIEDEREDGTATFTESSSVTFTANK